MIPAVAIQRRIRLKGQCHENLTSPFFFSLNKFMWAPYGRAEGFPNIASISWRYSNIFVKKDFFTPPCQ